MSFLRSYLSYACDNEAPEMFHVWCAYSCISAVVRRACWLPWGRSAVYPMTYIMLIGSAGSGKSWAMDLAIMILDEFKDEVKKSYDIETPEGFIQFMAGNPRRVPLPLISPCYKLMEGPGGQLVDTYSMFIHANEFVDFISKNPEGWMSMLTNIFNKKSYDYRTKNGTDDAMTGPCISVLGGIPTEITKRLQSDEIITSGFARRCLMQYGERKYHEPKPWPDSHPECTPAFDACVERLRHIATKKGPLELAPETRTWWEEWYVKHSLSLVKRSTSATQGWLSTKPEHLIKIALLTCLSDSDEMLITPQHFEVALAYLGEMEKTYGMVVGGVGRNELASVAVKILQHLTEVGEPVPIPYLASRFFNSFAAGKGAGELAEIITHLRNTDQIVHRELIINGIKSDVVCSPRAMEVYIENGKRAGVLAEAPNGLLTGTVSLTHPSVRPLPTPAFCLRTDQIVVQSTGEAEHVESPEADLGED